MMDGNSRNLEWVKNYPADHFESGDLEMIRTEWGPGQYQFRVYGNSPGVKSVVNVNIANDKKPGAAPVDNGLNVAVSALLESQQKMLEALNQRPDPMASMGAVLTMIGQVKGLFGGGEQKSSLTEAVEALRTLRDASAEINPPPPPPDESGGLLPMAGQIMSMLQTHMQNRPAPVMLGVDPVSIPQSLTQIDPSKPTETADMLDPAVKDFQSQIDMLLKLKSLPGSVAMASKIILQTAQDVHFDVLESDQWFDVLATLSPGVVDHRAWLTEVRDAVLALLVDEDNPPLESPSVAG